MGLPLRGADSGSGSVGMIFTPLKISGAFLIGVERLSDERGFFARTFCESEFATHGLCTNWPQTSISFNAKKQTLRGMHYQAAPHEEVKLVRCTRGVAFDVIIDLRPDSPTWKQWVGIEISAENHQAVYIPTGCAHGFLTLTDETELFYQINTQYHAQSARGVRFDDVAFGIEWPHSPLVIAQKDRDYFDYVQEQAV